MLSQKNCVEIVVQLIISRFIYTNTCVTSVLRSRNFMSDRFYNSIYEQLRKDQFLENRMGLKKYPNFVLLTQMVTPAFGTSQINLVCQFFSNVICVYKFESILLCQTDVGFCFFITGIVFNCFDFIFRWIYIILKSFYNSSKVIVEKYCKFRLL